MFPNPANNQLTFVSKNESEKLKITIKDINGRIVKEVDLKTMNFIANLELERTNGVYIISFRNSNNETINKKLLIAK